MTPIPAMPPIPCPDCGGWLRLVRKPACWLRSKNNPWVYRCERRGCDGLMSAHPDGSPMGTPVKKEIRRARHLCHEVFDRLWLEPASIYPLHHSGNKAEIAHLRRLMRDRAYHFMADRLGMPEPQAHIGTITDIETLRRFYAIAKAATPADIRAWWKGRREAA